MTRVLILAALFVLAPQLAPQVAPIAHADPVWRASGIRGHVTAYDLDGSLIDRRLCITHRSGAVEYASCSARLRDEVKQRKCTRYGAGTHHFYFQYGDSRPVRSSVMCPRRS